MTADATAWLPPEPADAVLLDAPCSATGTLRRHPDIACLKGPGEIAGLIEVQNRLLAQAAKMVKPGGLLVYAVCSLQPEEGPQRIAKFLSEDQPFERRPLARAELPGLEDAVTPDGDLRTLPSHLPERGGLDGFYACRLKRR